MRRIQRIAVATAEIYKIYRNNRREEGNGEKSLVLAYVLWFFLGFFGFHRFYLGSRAGLGQLALAIIVIVLFVTIRGQPIFSFLVQIPLIIWLLVDLLLIPRIANDN